MVLIINESCILWEFKFEIAYVICWLSISLSSFELKSKKSNNTSSLVTFSENTWSSAFLTKGPNKASAPGSSISPVIGLLSPSPLSVIVITTVSISPSSFSSTRVAPSSKVARFWSSKYWKTSPEDFVFK